MRFMATIHVLFLTAALTAVANQIFQYPPNYEISEGRVELPIELINDDNGAVYNSYDLYLFQSLGDLLWNLPHNQTNYVDADALRADWVVSVRPDPVGEVNAGWAPNTTSYSPVSFNHGPHGYDIWLATPQNPNQDMLSLVLSIPSSQLDSNGNGFSPDDPEDYLIALSASATTNMGVGRQQGGFPDRSTSAPEYLVVPWPRGLASSSEDGGSFWLTWTGLFPGTTNVVEASDSRLDSWQTNLVFMATGVTVSVSVGVSNDFEAFRLKGQR